MYTRFMTSVEPTVDALDSSTAIIAAIKALPWDNLDNTQAERLMLIMTHTATEFVETLKAALVAYPELTVLHEVASEEIDTDNLQYADYTARADHPDFMWHFVNGTNLLEKYPAIDTAGKEFRAFVSTLSPELKLQSIISRESVGPDIFTRLVANSYMWSGAALAAFTYYLKRHIELDSGDDGHGAQLAEHVAPNADSALVPFYKALYALFAKVWIT